MQVQKDSTAKGTSKGGQSRAWMVRFDAPPQLTEQVLESMFDPNSYRYTARIMRSMTATESHPEGYTHVHLFVQSRTGSPIKKTTIWNTVGRTLTAIDPDEYPPDRNPSIYCAKPQHGVRACVDYVNKAEKICDAENGKVSEIAVSGIVTNCNVYDFKGYGAEAPKAVDLYEAILTDGVSRSELFHDASMADAIAPKMNYVEALFAQKAEDDYGSTPRDVSTIYLYGPSGTGKTVAVYTLLSGGRPDLVAHVFKVDDWTRSPWDGYDGQDILWMDDLRLPQVEKVMSFSDLLRVLDRMPYRLPRRYRNGWAGWTTVVITSNWSPKKQVDGIVDLTAEDRAAFFRRLTRVIRVDEQGILHDETAQYHSATEGRGRIDVRALAGMLAEPPAQPIPPEALAQLPDDVRGIELLEAMGAVPIASYTADQIAANDGTLPLGGVPSPFGGWPAKRDDA